MEKELKKALYLDDMRVPLKAIPGYEDWVVVKNYDEFVAHIEEHGVPDYISFGHDLAQEHTEDFVKYQGQGIPAINYSDYKEKTGLDCLKWLCEHIMKHNEITTTTPENHVRLELKLVGVHSHNPMGAQNILNMANSFKEHMGWAADAFIAKPEFDIPGKDRPVSLDLVEVKKPNIIT